MCPELLSQVTPRILLSQRHKAEAALSVCTSMQQQEGHGPDL